MNLFLTLILLFVSINLKAETNALQTLNDTITENKFNEVKNNIPIPKVETNQENEDKYFNNYISKAILEIYSKYKLKGYDINSVLTHDINFYNLGIIKSRNAPLTMCVAAQLEIILTAYEIYARETNDYSPYYYLPKSSYENLSINDLKGHIWVNHNFNSYGTSDALFNFGMGEKITFDKLKTGAFININRNNGTGHAVTFIGYIDKNGHIQNEYNSNVIGFRYFSAQGLKEEGHGGFDYRNAIFSQFGCPSMDFKRDCDVIYSENQIYLNTGMMLMPKYWKLPKRSHLIYKDTVFNGNYFNGQVTDY